MNKLLYAAVSLILFCFCSLKSVAQSTDEMKVRAIIQKGEESWNAHDYSFSGENDTYAPDAVLINPVGMYWKNRAEIIKSIQTFGAMMFKYESVKYNKVDVCFLTPTVALAIIQSTGKVDQDHNMPDGSKGRSKGDTNEGISSVVLVKKNNKWKIAFQQLTSVDANAAAFNPVK